MIKREQGGGGPVGGRIVVVVVVLTLTRIYIMHYCVFHNRGANPSPGPTPHEIPVEVPNDVTGVNLKRKQIIPGNTASYRQEYRATHIWL